MPCQQAIKYDYKKISSSLDKKKLLNFYLRKMLDDFSLLSELVNTCTVKSVYNDHSWDPKFVAVVDRWSLLRCSFML